MIEIEFSASGIFALALDPQFPEQYRRLVRRCHRQAWQEWARMSQGTKGLMSRFGHEAFARFGFGRRSYKYERRQRRVFGERRPYESPNPKRPAALKMRGLMQSEGVGWRMALRGGGDEVTSHLTLPGARALIFQKAPIYRKQFLALDTRKAEADWIKNRVAELAQEALEKMAQRAQRRRLKGAA